MKQQWTIVDGPADPSQIKQGGSVVFSVTDEAEQSGSLEITDFHAHQHFFLRHKWNIVGRIKCGPETANVYGLYSANTKSRTGVIYEI